MPGNLSKNFEVSGKLCGLKVGNEIHPVAKDVLPVLTTNLRDAVMTKSGIFAAPVSK